MDDFTDDQPPISASRQAPDASARPADPAVDDAAADDAAADDALATDPGPAWSGLSRGPRAPAEGVRIIGAEEAAAAIEAGQVSPRVPDSEPRFGDVPETPPEPRPGLRFPGADPASVSKPPVVVPDPPPSPYMPPPPEPAAPLPSFTGRVPSDAPWPDFLGADPAASEESSPFWDPPVVATAPRGRFEELVTAQNDLPPLGPSASGGFGPSASGGFGPSADALEPDLGRPVMSDRQVTPDRPLVSDPISGEWAVASGLGGGIDPMGGGARRNLPGAEPAAASPSSDWDRLTGASGGGQVGDDRSWDSFDDSDDLFGPKRTAAAPAAAGERPPPGPEDSGTVALPHWTEPPSGEVPRILADAPGAETAPDEELSAWSALSSGPRWRDQPADWDEADFHDTVLDDREARLGALRDQPESDEDDDIFAFDQAAAAPPSAASAVQGRGQGTATDVRPTRLPRGASPRGPRGGNPRGGTVVPGGAPPAGTSGGGSDLSTRVVTGLIAAGVVLAAAAVGPAALVVLVMAAVTMAAAELFQGLRARGYQPATLLGLVGCAAMVLGAYWRGEQAFPLILSLMVIFSFLWYLAGVVRARPTQNIAVTLFAFLYVGFLGSFAALFLRVPNGEGVGLLLGAVIATAAHDIGAYVVGKYAGKTPLAPELSPNKTFEGLVGGVLASVAVSMIVVGQIGPWDVGKAFWLGVVVAVVAPLGDLCESMIKRDLSLKDMGKLLPGHGGVLDRIDALLFVIPASYYLARLIF